MPLQKPSMSSLFFINKTPGFVILLTLAYIKICWGCFLLLENMLFKLAKYQTYLIIKIINFISFDLQKGPFKTERKKIFVIT